ncbi:helix-turn-helix domain-containing protein [Ktedonospora formicarum]|uniref:HTH merR-type domain-containing protein n=1 Tax=Ktedonospora formicarum TaxID=2778364 RepID=A0A8J3MTZ9_9CHLR|nr:helix-turn-helix domain-containing protein [Ktedonospora formicarum]GHO44915.1 hypothetical protein KSX_30780 [Ktedonospora formicarum]
MQTAKIKDLYYTAGEARKVLDLSDDKFQYWVKAGRIEKVLLPGRKQYLYPKQSVDKLARRIEAAIIADVPEGLIYRKAAIEDLEEEFRLSYLIFGKAAHTVATRRNFLEHNPDVDYHLYDHNDLVAFINIIPFKQEAIQSFMQGQLRGKDLDVRDIEPFVPGQPLECIVMEMATTPTVPPARRTLYGTQLLMGLSETFREWGEQGIIVTKLHGTSSTPTGIRIMQSAGFKVVEQLGIDRGSERLAFELDIVKSDAKILKGYHEALKNRRSH